MKKLYKLEFYVPETHCEEVKRAVFDVSGGRIGNYDCCSWETIGTGQFRGLEGSTPFIGKIGTIEKIKEIKVELVFEEVFLEDIKSALLKSHPYETPAYNFIEILV